MRLTRIITLGLALGALALAPSVTADAAAVDCTDESGVCIAPTVKGALFQAGKKATTSQKRKRGKGEDGNAGLTVENGRGSLFVNGRYAGTAPLDPVPVPAGANDIQVRDGMITIVEGILWMPKGATLNLTVVHP